MRPLTRTIVVDSLAFAGFVLLTTTGVLLHYLLPPGSGRRATLWSLDRHDWGAIHFYIALGTFAVLTVHLFLHRRWIAGLFRGHAGEHHAMRAAAGVVGLLALLAVGVGPLVSPVERLGPGRAAAPRDAGEPQTGRIRGSLSLQELEYFTGVPAAEVIAALGLPADTPTGEQLGRLAARHGFRMRDVRAAIEAARPAGEPLPPRAAAP